MNDGNGVVDKNASHMHKTHEHQISMILYIFLIYIGICYIQFKIQLCLIYKINFA